MKQNNGDIFNGSFKNNLKEGKGKMKYNYEDIYIDNYKNCKIEVNGILITSEG